LNWPFPRVSIHIGYWYIAYGRKEYSYPKQPLAGEMLFHSFCAKDTATRYPYLGMPMPWMPIDVASLMLVDKKKLHRDATWQFEYTKSAWASINITQLHLAHAEQMKRNRARTWDAQELMTIFPPSSA
jgi:hypothetical protein